MASTNIKSVSIGSVLIQSGNGTPNHISTKGSLYIDMDTATEYINKDGVALWELNGVGGFVLTQDQYDAITGATSPSSTNVFATISDLSATSFTGGTVNGATNFLNGLSATTISATTYFNLPKDIYVTGATYSAGTAVFTNNTGGTFSISGFYTGYTAPIDVRVTGGTYSSGTGIASYTNNTGGTFNVSGFFKPSDDIFTTGLTFNNSTYDLKITRNDGTIFSQNLAILATDMTITGGTYNANTGVATFTNNTGGTFSVSGFLTGMTDTYTTGFTYSNNLFTLKRNASQPDLSVLVNSMSGLTISGSLSANSISATTYYNLPTDVYVTGGTYSSGNTLFINNTGGTFNISGYYSGTTNLGNILFVSPNGNDSTATKGYIDKPYLTLNAAKTAAVSGDTIYVFPQTFIFDNSLSIYDANPDYVNLWKDGVTYYWTPGCKVKLISSIANSTKIFLFRPNINVYETCKTLGYLEYEQYSYVPSNGNCFYFSYSDTAGQGTTGTTDYGCTFFSQTKSQVGYGGTLISLVRGTSTNTSAIMDITIISDYESNVWVNGHSGGSFGYSLFGSNVTDCPITFKSYVRDRVYSNNSFLTIREKWGSGSYVYFNGETLKQDGYVTANRIIEPRITSTITLEVDIKKIYYSTVATSTVNACVIADNSNNSSLGTVINLKGDLIASAPNADPIPLFSLGFYTTINYNGNIYTNTTANAGNTIATSNSSNSKIYINSNINYIGTGVTTNTVFKTSSSGTLKFTGSIRGNFAGAIAQCGTGTIEINDSNIKSTISGSTAYLLLNGGTSLGTIRVNGSYIELNNPTNPLSNGSYVNNFINNSTIVNSGGSGLSNTTSFGFLQLLNSTIITSGTSINYTSTAPVISSNSTTNNTYNINTLNGDISTITEITF